MKTLSAEEKDFILETVNGLISSLDNKIQRTYSRAYFERNQKVEKYESLPWYRRIFCVNPGRNLNEVTLVHHRVRPLENCIGELIMVRSKFPATAIARITMTNDHYAQYQKAIQEARKLIAETI